jgi:hypothetical protein
MYSILMSLHLVSPGEPIRAFALATRPGTLGQLLLVVLRMLSCLATPHTGPPREGPSMVIGADVALEFSKGLSSSDTGIATFSGL